MTTRQKAKNKKFEKISKDIQDMEPWAAKEDVLECIGHEDVIQKILTAFGNRKDADRIFVSAILKSGRFWAWTLLAIVVVAVGVSYLFSRFPSQTTHAFEKTINAYIPDFFPIQPQR